MPVAIDGADRRLLAEDRVDDAGGEEAGEDGAEGSACAVDTEGVQRVVVTEEALHDEDHEEANEAGEEAYGQSAHRLDKAGSRGDGDQSRSEEHTSELQS